MKSNNYLTLKNKEKKSLNLVETVQPNLYCWGMDKYINVSLLSGNSCNATVAQFGRAPASKVGVQPDVRVQSQNFDENPGSGAQILSLIPIMKVEEQK